MADEQALGTDDYQQLHGMVTSDDPKVQARGQAIAKKLTPDEQQAFFDYQKQANAGKGERTRIDDQSPEILGAVAAGTGIARAVSAPGLSLVARGVAGAKATAGAVTPVLKYEIVKSGLERMGVPTPLAMLGAMAVSGYKKGAAAPAATGASVAGEAAPATTDATAAAASAPVGAPAPAPGQPMAAAPVAPPAPAAPAVAAPEAVALTPSKIASSVWTAARDAKVQLTADQNKAAFDAIKGGAAPADAVASVTKATATDVPKLTAAEMVQAQKWMKDGIPYQQILDRIQQSRALTGALGTPTPDAAAATMRTLKATKYKQ